MEGKPYTSGQSYCTTLYFKKYLPLFHKKHFLFQISSSRRRKQKPVIWQDSLIHAREWITGATLLWVANQLVVDYKANVSLVVKLFKKFDFVFVPVWNVDGYIHSWKNVSFVYFLMILYFVLIILSSI